MNQWKLVSRILTGSCGTNIYTSCTAWTGGNDRSTEGRFLWDHSNTLIGFKNWHPQEPSSATKNENCIALLKDGRWNDVFCGVSYSYICEKNYI